MINIMNTYMLVGLGEEKHTHGIPLLGGCPAGRESVLEAASPEGKNFTPIDCDHTYV